MVRRLRRSLICVTLLIGFHSLRSQSVSSAPIIQVCPGAFPTDLTQTDCRYTFGKRASDYVTGSLTDQAALSAVVFGLGAQIVESPPEWKRTWRGYGQRVGARYTQTVGKGTAEFLVGAIFRDDPRFVAYRDEPNTVLREREAVRTLSGSSPVFFQPSLTAPASCGGKQVPLPTTSSSSPLEHDGWRRFGHAWYDVVSIRRSSVCGNGRRIPAFSRFASEFAGAYAGYPWYPRAENTFPKVGERAAGAFGTAALSSFYTEYKPEITRLLGAILHHGKQSQPTAGGTP